MNIVWHNYPTVSALLVLCDSSRFPLARRAVECFAAQEWPHRNLVIVNSTGQSFMSGEICVPRKGTEALRKLAVECAHGEWCVWWSDECWFAPTYIHAHMLASSRERQTIVRTVTSYAVDSQRQALSRMEDLTGFFRLCQNPKEFHVIDGRELVLHFIRERTSHS